MPSWQGINEFLAVVESGSFTRAAETLGLSKSYLSRAVAQLEARLGAQLIVRTTRRLALTAAGDVFFNRCRALRNDLSDVEHMMTEFHSRPMGRLEVALSGTFGAESMSALLAHFASLHRDIAIEATLYMRESELSQEQFDVVIRYGALEDSTAHARPFSYLSYCLCAAPDYVAEFGWPTSPDDLGRHNCVSNPTGAFVFNGGVRAKVAGLWTGNSGVSLHWATLHGLGISHLPVSLVRHDLLSGRLVALEEDWTYYDQEVSAVFPAGITPSATRAFVDYLTTHVSFNKARPNPGSIRSLNDRLERYHRPRSEA